MPSEPSEPLPNFSLRTPEAPRASAAELNAKYQRIKHRQRILAGIGVAFLIFLYLFLRYILPWIGASRPPFRSSQAPTLERTFPMLRQPLRALPNAGSEQM